MVAASRQLTMVKGSERLYVAILIHEWNQSQLRAVLDSLVDALLPLCSAGLSIRVTLLDNGSPSDPCRLEPLIQSLKSRLPQAEWHLHGGLANQGYGAGHNVALEDARIWRADWHLVLNPDVLLEPDALAQGLAWLRGEQDCGLVSPLCRGWSDGQKQYLARTAPTPWLLLLRNLPARIQSLGWVARTLDRHLYAHLPQSHPVKDVETQSGCFMLGPLQAFIDVAGFDERFFMYFEDLDLSLRMRRAGWRIDRVPSVSIAHAGGAAGRKGITHVRYFLASALRFFLYHPALLWGRDLQHDARIKNRNRL